ncbi:hypothetical protein [Agrobacterium tumefaciens]|jgi:hypothetical protein|uniref:hypothetical protein n=1 Tax=Agrobacterium tumefaciens TaxID=358 RepID=UPI000FA570E9|nr:hypothetical protein [Agrobacterium tumefaciens]NSX92530.1 hypothetical protein [Agrobacterium tumefaciens]
MDYELITDDDYETLPSEPEKRFTTIERICRKNMLAIISNETSQPFDSLVRTQYMTIVTASAEELGIPGIRYINEYQTVEQDLNEFFRLVTGVTAKIRLRNSSSRDALSVRLASKTKGLIENELTKLRASVEESNLSDDKKERLLGKIGEFRTELHKERLRFGVSLSVLASIGAMVGGTTAFLAEAPQAIATITHLIGVDKQKEDEEILRLEGPTKPRLLAPPPSATKGSWDALDDDIPF